MVPLPDGRGRVRPGARREDRRRVSVEPTERLSGDRGYTGVVSAFRKAGFVEVLREGRGRSCDALSRRSRETLPLDAITAIPGLRVGHWTNRRAATGCTVVLCEGGAVAAVDVRGGAPGTRETDVLRPGNLVDRVHAVLVSAAAPSGWTRRPA